jgi:hypothetical protein
LDGLPATRLSSLNSYAVWMAYLPRG